MIYTVGFRARRLEVTHLNLNLNLNLNFFRRFITLIDTLYEQRTRLVLISEMEAGRIFDIGALSEKEKKNAVQDEVFAWDRTVSRLIEMQSMDYLIERAQVLHQLDLILKSYCVR